jgi:hypothetical protein
LAAPLSSQIPSESPESSPRGLVKAYDLSIKLTIFFYKKTPAMPPNNLRELAKQGNPKVIAQIINHSLQKKGIKVDVVRSNTSLEVTLESEQVASQKKALVEFIRNGMDKLGVESINTVTVYGVPTGQSSPVWEEEIILAPEGIPHPQPIPEEDPLYATEEAETALETDEDYQTEPPDDLSEDEEELFDEEDEVNSEGDFEEDSEGDFEEDSEGDFEEDSEGDFEEDSEVTSQPAKKKLPILAIVIPLVILIPLVALAVLHFTGIFRLPFLGGSQADSSTPNTVESPEASPSSAETTSSPTPGSPSPSPDGPSGEEIWKNATATAYGAAVKAGSAQTRAEWNEVASEWQKAIDLMKEVPESNPNYQTAQQKVQEYQNNLNVAKQRAARAQN